MIKDLQIQKEEKEEDFNPNYYGIIPASVRYCKELPANAKLLYSELSALTNKNGYCYAHNNYFAKLYDVSNSTVSQWISKLEENNFINIVNIKSGNAIKERRIYIADCKNMDSRLENSNRPASKNPKDNINIYNNINLNNLFSDELCSSASSGEEVKENEINQNEYNILKSNLNPDDYDILDYLDVNSYKLDSYFLNAKFNGMYMDTVGISPCLLLELAKGKQVIKSDIVTESDNKKEKEEVPVEERESNTCVKESEIDLSTSVKKSSETQKSGDREDFCEKTTNNTSDAKKDALNKLSEKLNLQKGTEYVADKNPSKKVKRSKKAPKELSDLQKIKNHYLENRKKMYDEGKCSTPIDSTNSVVVNQRLNALLDMGVTVEQFCKVFDFAMTDDFCKNTVDYKFMPIIKENVFMRLYNDKNCGAVERVIKPAVPSFKNIKAARPVCKTCGEELDYQGKCPFCD